MGAYGVEALLFICFRLVLLANNRVAVIDVAEVNGNILRVTRTKITQRAKQHLPKVVNVPPVTTQR